MINFREKPALKEENLGENIIIHEYVWIGPNVKIGSNTKIQAFSFIPDGVSIGENCFIGPHVCFTNDKKPPSKGKEWMDTVVKNNVSIGANVTILPGVTIGEGSLIGAGSVVTKDVLPGKTVVGNPAHYLADN